VFPGARYVLYTREGWPGNGSVDIVYHDLESLRASNFSIHRPTKFVVHGFLNDETSPWIYAMKDELLKNVRIRVRRCTFEDILFC